MIFCNRNSIIKLINKNMKMKLPKSDSVMQYLKVVDQEWLKENIIKKKKPQIWHKVENNKYIVFDSTKFQIGEIGTMGKFGYPGKFSLNNVNYPTFIIRNAVSLYNAANLYEGSKTVGLVLKLGNKNSKFLDESPFISVFLKGLIYHISDVLETKKRDVNFFTMNSTKIYKGENIKTISKGKENKNKNLIKGFKIGFFDSSNIKAWEYKKNKTEYGDKNVIFTVNAPHKGMKGTYTRFLDSSILEKDQDIKKKVYTILSKEEAIELDEAEKNLPQNKKTKYITKDELISFKKSLKEMKERVYTYENINQYINKGAIIRKLKVSISGFWVSSATKQLSLRLNVGGIWFVPGIPQDDEDLSDQEALSDEDEDEDEEEAEDEAAISEQEEEKDDVYDDDGPIDF